MIRFNNVLLLGLIWPGLLAGRQSPELAQILERLDKIEQENRALAAQVQELRNELAARQAPPASNAAASTPASATPGAAAAPTAASTTEERLDVVQIRVEEQAQTKVEASQKYPISLTGMALFNAYLNSRLTGGGEYPTAASLNPGTESASATLRQTIIGLEFHGPQTLLGGTVHGSVYMDFYTGGINFNSMFRLRTGAIHLDWKTRSVMVGIDKPIFNPREPTSLAQVGISPLTGAGNLWLWVPQARVEQDFAFTGATGVRLVTGVIETHESPPYDNPSTVTVAPNRPAIEGRYEFYHNLGEDRRIEIASGFHVSTTHAGGFSIPSHVLSFDGLYKPNQRLEVTGVFFTGQNVSNLGTGIIDNGFAVYRSAALAIAARGGWAQLTIHAVRRLDFHFFGGAQYYEGRAIGYGDANRDEQYGANLFYHIAPNVILGPEISQIRTLYVTNGTRLFNHYDMAVAYLF
jgi:hypothetical protein